ncbi:MAG: glycosyltransferase family 2 protein [Alphaproteobacteria bacterium]|nr:glycosyltransferase family 2 protein [Alphaproteobacteria bacterium]
MKPSVIVCTRNRGHKIRECLESIDASLRHAKPSEAEIVVVNNGSTDDTEEVVKSFARNAVFPVNHVYEERPGLNVARNRGLRTATGDLLLYTDDDCRMDVGHIKQALEYHECDERPVLRFGRVDLGDPQDWPMTIHTCPHVRRWQKDHPEWGYPSMGNIIGCNMTFPKSIYNDIGGFDDRFGNPTIPGGDDTDFGFRAFYKGYKLEYVPDMAVKHYHGRRDAESVWRLIRNYSIGAGALYGKYGFNHPHIKRIFAPKPTESPRAAPARTDERSATIHAFHKKAKIYYLVGLRKYVTISLRLALRKGCGKDKSEETVRAAS